MLGVCGVFEMLGVLGVLGMPSELGLPGMLRVLGDYGCPVVSGSTLHKQDWTKPAPANARARRARVWLPPLGRWGY